MNGTRSDQPVKNEPVKTSFEGRTCEEASMLSVRMYIPCGKPATFLVKNRDPKPYFMCEACADHNVRNRGAKILASAGSTGEERFFELASHPGV